MTILILAAGAARRMEKQKLLLPIDGRPMIEHVLAAAAAWPIVVVAGAEVAPTLGARTLRIVRNDAPERGMSHSLQLGNAVIDEAEPIAVLLADLPDISAKTIAETLEAYDNSVDVVVPRCGKLFAHPVVFGPAARQKITALPDGDTIKRLRDDPNLRRKVVETDSSALIDIDTPTDYKRRVERGSPGQRVR
jgi:molybdenum cofactor cytidylyltransferase